MLRNLCAHRTVAARLGGRCAALLMVVGMCITGACTHHGGDMRSDVSAAGDGAQARVFLQPCLAMRFTVPHSLSPRAGRSLNPDALSVADANALLALQMPHPNQVPAGTEAREIIERVSGKRIVWVYAGTHDAHGKKMEAVEHVDYLKLYVWSCGDDGVRHGTVPEGRTLGDLLGTWLDMTRGHFTAFAHAAKSDPDVEFTPVLMMTPSALQFVPFPEVMRSADEQ